MVGFSFFKLSVVYSFNSDEKRTNAASSLRYICADRVYAKYFTYGYYVNKTNVDFFENSGHKPLFPTNCVRFLKF